VRVLYTEERKHEGLFVRSKGRETLSDKDVNEKERVEESSNLLGGGGETERKGLLV